MTEDHSQKGLAAAKGSQPDITNGLTGHEGDGSGMYNITIWILVIECSSGPFQIIVTRIYMHT